MSCVTASVRPVIGVPGAGKVFTCFASKAAARARWLFVNSVAESNTSIKCGGSAPSPVFMFVSREPMCWIAWISSTRAMRVCAGIITGLHVQSAGFIVHGSELYIKIGIFQSSASASTSDLPTSRPNS